MKVISKRIVTLVTLALVLSASAWAQGQQHQGQGQHGQRGRGPGQMQDMQTIHQLFDGHQQITRTIKPLANGVETLTESNDPKLQALIKEHVWAMQQRLEKRQPIRMWDPLFVELFNHADQIQMEIHQTAKGMKVIETSTDPYVVKLIQAHAQGVSEFVKEGASVMHKPHEVPETAPAKPGSFLGKGDGITTCPVTGEPVNPEIKFGFYGRTVYFCCESCREAVKKNPELYLKP